MNPSATCLVLRAIAVLIAIVALIDPVWSTSRTAPRELIAVTMSATDASGTVSALATAASGWAVVTRDAIGGRIPCAPDERCVVIADGSRDADLPRDLSQ
ncbi:MAG TPA: hypothetical protein VF491_06045, partial [Vicinamibacterales bacterium]